MVRKKILNSHGMTMAELLLVVAIIIVLSGVGFISVINHQRDLALTERDTIAKEIFVAAQNHLTMAKGEKYLGVGVESYGKETAASDGIYYYAVNGGMASDNATDMFDQTLPFGAIEETVRGGGSYIISYQPDAGLVLNVFYCSAEGSRFGHNLVAGEYSNLMSDYSGDDRKEARKNYVDKSVVGWYGGAEAAELEEVTLAAPKLEVVNAETLYVRITDKENASVTNHSIRLFITGKTTRKGHYVDILVNGNLPTRDKSDVSVESDGVYKFALDDITRGTDDHFANKHFYSLKTTVEGEPTGKVPNEFIPGEDITVQAVAYTNNNLSNVARSEQKITNSLFAGVEDTNNNETLDVAYISNIRHLENLDKKVSKLEKNDAITPNNSDGVLIIKRAVQTADLDWNDFLEKIKEQKIADNIDYSGGISVSYGEGEELTPSNTVAGCYKPVDFDNMKLYDGKGHSIKNIKVEIGETIDRSLGDAGLFNIVSGSTQSTLKNLELINFKITTNNGGNAGALAGELVNAGVVNVIARNSDGVATTNITGANAGGLVGRMTGGSAVYSAAAVIVNGNGTGEGTGAAGGLIGKTMPYTSDGLVTIDRCYSGGHTKNGSYKEWVNSNHIYDVTGSIAGGLIGNAGSAEIQKSYSTCSVSGSTNAGGFVGTATVAENSRAGSISNCYCTGLVETKTLTSANTAEGKNPNSGKGAFAGVLSDGVARSNCGCFEIINEITKGTEENTAGTFERYLYPVGDDKDNTDGIGAIDGNTQSYERFVQGSDKWNPAKVYDSKLKGYYHSGNDAKFNLRTVDQLPVPESGNGKNLTTVGSKSDDNYHRFVITHYGDWPAPELFVINN